MSLTGRIDDVVGRIRDEFNSLRSFIQANYAENSHLHDDRYLKLIGGTLTGGLTINSTEGLNFFNTNSSIVVPSSTSTAFNFNLNGNTVGSLLRHSTNSARLQFRQFSTVGTAANAPVYSFIESPTTGMYTHRANELGLVSNGNTVFYSNTDGSVYIGGGSISTHTINAGVTLSANSEESNIVSFRDASQVEKALVNLSGGFTSSANYISNSGINLTGGFSRIMGGFTGGWARTIAEGKNTDVTGDSFRLGLYGYQDSYTYGYIGFGNHISSKLKLYPDGHIETEKLYVGGAVSPSSQAMLQVNGFIRSGTIYLHPLDGTSADATTSTPLSNLNGDLRWDTDTVYHTGNLDLSNFATAAQGILSDNSVQYGSRGLVNSYPTNIIQNSSGGVNKDYNTCTEAGWHGVLLNNVSNRPATGYFYLQVLEYNNSSICQIAYPYGSDPGSSDTYSRTRFNGTWSAWRKVWDSGNFDATNIARLGNTTINDNYLYLNRTSSGPVIYMKQLGTGAIAEFISDTSAVLRVQNDGNLERYKNHHRGGLIGSYNSVGANGAKSNPIYCIGSNYQPNEDDLSNMFGVGFAQGGQASFLNATGLGVAPIGWGLYLADNGVSRIFLESDTGRGYFKSHIYAEQGVFRSTVTAPSFSGDGTNVTNVNAETLNGLPSTSYLKSDIDDSLFSKIITGSVSSNRNTGIYGVYNASRWGHIWGMGAAYRISDDGTDLVNFYGAAYKYSNTTTTPVGERYGVSHQFVWCINGTPNIALGSNLWVANKAGIGVENPTEKLEVAGNVKATAFIGDLPISSTQGSGVTVTNESDGLKVVVNQSSGGSTDIPWQSITPTQGTGSFNYKIKNGRLIIDAAVTPTSETGNSSEIGNLPAAHRPDMNLIFIPTIINGTGTNAEVTLQIISGTGLITIINSELNKQHRLTADFPIDTSD